MSARPDVFPEAEWLARYQRIRMADSRHPLLTNANGRRAFLWVDGDQKNPEFRYLVSFPNGTFAEDAEKSLEACEAVAARILKQQ